jgi:hypothetical protein
MIMTALWILEPLMPMWEYSQWSGTMHSVHRLWRHLRQTESFLNFDQHLGFAMICNSIQRQFRISKARILSSRLSPDNQSQGTKADIDVVWTWVGFDILQTDKYQHECLKRGRNQPMDPPSHSLQGLIVASKSRHCCSFSCSSSSFPLSRDIPWLLPSFERVDRKSWRSENRMA